MPEPPLKKLVTTWGAIMSFNRMIGYQLLIKQIVQNYWQIQLKNEFKSSNFVTTTYCKTEVKFKSQSFDNKDQNTDRSAGLN